MVESYKQTMWFSYIKSFCAGRDIRKKVKAIHRMGENICESDI